MTEEIVSINTAENDYIDTIQQLKQNTVSRVEYDRIRQDNKKLLDAMLTGATAEVEQPQETPKMSQQEIQSLRDELYGGRYEGTDLDYMTKVLKLRKGVMENGGSDPAVSSGKNTVATQGDYEMCDAVCNILQECVDQANGDPALFRANLMRNMR